MIGHGIVGCLSADLSGGNCGQGAVAAAAGELATAWADSAYGGDRDRVNALIHGVVNPALAALTSGGDFDQFDINQNITNSQLANNYLTHAQRELADKVVAGLARCGAGPFMSSGDRAACSNAQQDLKKLQLASAINTISMLNACRGNPNSSACTNARQEAADYLEWSSGLFNLRDNYFDVSAAEIADVDWGGNLDALALDVYDQGKSGEAAYKEITGRAISYDGRMNLAVGVGTVALSGIACVGTVGYGCAVAVGAALLSEANNIYDGGATLYTKTAQKGMIQHMLEAGNLAPEQARLWENRVELGLSIVTFGVDGVVTLRNVAKSGQLLDDVVDYGKADINPLEIKQTVEAAKEGGQASKAATIGGKASEKITWIDEGASMSSRAKTYDEGAMGSRSNIETSPSFVQNNAGWPDCSGPL